MRRSCLVLSFDSAHANLDFYIQNSAFGILHVNKKLEELKTGLGGPLVNKVLCRIVKILEKCKVCVFRA